MAYPLEMYKYYFSIKYKKYTIVMKTKSKNQAPGEWGLREGPHIVQF